MKKIICLIISLLLVATAGLATAETEYETTVYVTARLLNARMAPSKTAMRTGLFDRGDELYALGWSEDHEWVKVSDGNDVRNYVKMDYVTERTDIYRVVNEEYPKVKIRKKPWAKSKVKGYLKKGRSIEIKQTLFGWGRCKLGWIDLSFVEEVKPATETSPKIEGAKSDP